MSIGRYDFGILLLLGKIKVCGLKVVLSRKMDRVNNQHSIKFSI